MRGQDRDAGDENAGDHAEKYRQQERNRSPQPPPHPWLLARWVLELIRRRAARLFAGKYGNNESLNASSAERIAALIAWMLVVRVDDLVKDQ